MGRKGKNGLGLEHNDRCRGESCPKSVFLAPCRVGFYHEGIICRKRR